MYAQAGERNESLGIAGVLAVAIAAVLLLYVQRRWPSLASQKHPFPPGPAAIPLIGNIFQVSPNAAWLKFTKYKATHGDLLFFHGLGNHVLVLNSIAAITDLLDNKWDIYSDRPFFTVVCELMALGQSMPLLPYGSEWRAHRKLAHIALNPTAIKKYHIIQENTAAILCNDLLSTPEDFFALVRLASTKIILNITYGISVDSPYDQYVTHVDDTMHAISRATVPAAFLCDLIPALKYLPSWVSFKREALKGKQMIERLLTMPYEHVKQQMVSGNAPPSLASDLLSTESDDMVLFDHRVKWTTGALYGAGGETTYATVLNFMMAMSLYPISQARAQAEIDRVIGPNRLPTIADLHDLPYVNAIIKETMRWRPVLPLSIARSSAKDDVYNGFFIPKGTIVVPNVWAVAHEPNDKYDPHEFMPERFLDPAQSIAEPSSWAFGFGRRACPGKALGENSVFIIIACMLASFNIAPAGNGFVPKSDLNLISYPKPFECSITRRNEERANVVRSRAAECKA